MFSAPSIWEQRKLKSWSVSPLIPPESWICFTIWSAQWSSSCLVEMMLKQVQDECQQEHRDKDKHHRTEIIDVPTLIFQYGCRVPAGPARMGRCPAGCFGHCVGNCLWQSKTTAFLTKTAVSLDGKRLLYIFLTVPSIAWMPLRGKSRTVPMLCQFCAFRKKCLFCKF